MMQNNLGNSGHEMTGALSPSAPKRVSIAQIDTFISSIVSCLSPSGTHASALQKLSAQYPDKLPLWPASGDSTIYHLALNVAEFSQLEPKKGNAVRAQVLMREILRADTLDKGYDTASPSPFWVQRQDQDVIAHVLSRSEQASNKWDQFPGLLKELQQRIAADKYPKAKLLDDLNYPMANSSSVEFVTSQLLRTPSNLSLPFTSMGLSCILTALSNTDIKKFGSFLDLCYAGGGVIFPIALTTNWKIIGIDNTQSQWQAGSRIAAGINRADIQFIERDILKGKLPQIDPNGTIIFLDCPFRDLASITSLVKNLKKSYGNESVTFWVPYHREMIRELIRQKWLTKVNEDSEMTIFQTKN